MNSVGQPIKIFIVRVWIEPREIDDDVTIWRGSAQVVERDSTLCPDGEQPALQQSRAFKSLEELVDFLARHMIHLGIPANLLLGSGSQQTD